MRRARLVVGTTLAGLTLVACSGSDDTDAEGTSANDEAAQLDLERELSGDDTGDGSDDQLADPEPAAGEEAGNEEAEASGEAATDITSSAIQNALDGRHVIYYVDVAIETENISRASQQAVAIAQTSGGFVASESTHGDESATITLRVPVDQHTSIISRLEELGTVVERFREAQDVTSEVVDVDSRIESQQRSIARIRALLDEATDLSDVVSIESELARREASLDSLLSRQAELSSLTTLATITVTFQQIGEGTDDDDEDPTFLGGLGAGWDAFTSAVTYVAVGLGAALPFLGVAAIIGVPLVVLRRRSATASATLEE